MGDQPNGANLGFENALWRAADALRSNMDAAEYKHIVLGLIFLKAFRMRARYWTSTSRSSNMNCETSCKAGRGGASAGCAAGVRG
jgi:hypothetical protein